MYMYLQVKEAAKVIVESINDITSEDRQSCAEYSLSSITSALEAAPKSKLLTFKKSVNDVIGELVR